MLGMLLEPWLCLREQISMKKRYVNVRLTPRAGSGGTDVIYRNRRHTQMYTTELKQTQQEVIEVWFVMRCIFQDGQSLVCGSAPAKRSASLIPVAQSELQAVGGQILPQESCPVAQLNV